MTVAIDNLRALLADRDAEIGRTICASDAEAIVMTLYEDPSTLAYYNALAEAFGTLRDMLPALVEAVEAAVELYERVEMDESVGICLSDRVPSLRVGAALAPLMVDGERS